MVSVHNRLLNQLQQSLYSLPRFDRLPAQTSPSSAHRELVHTGQSISLTIALFPGCCPADRRNSSRKPFQIIEDHCVPFSGRSRQRNSKFPARARFKCSVRSRAEKLELLARRWQPLRKWPVAFQARLRTVIGRHTAAGFWALGGRQITPNLLGHTLAVNASHPITIVGYGRTQICILFRGRAR